MKQFAILLTLLVALAAQAQEFSSVPSDENWSAPEFCDRVNHAGAEAYPWLSADGLRVYLTQQDQGSRIEADSRQYIYMAKRKRTEDAFGETVPIELPNVEHDVMSVWLTSDELNIYYGLHNLEGEGRLVRALRPTVSSPFVKSDEIRLLNCPDGFLSGPSLSQDKSELFIYRGYITEAQSILIFRRLDDLTYEFDRKLPLPDGMIPSPGQLSKNDMRFYLGLCDSVNSKQLHYVERESRTAEFGAPVRIALEGITDSLHLTQPSVAVNDQMMVFVQSNGRWYNNDLYFTRSKVPTEEVPSGLTPVEVKPLSIYPNPVISELFLDFTAPQGEKTVLVQVADMQGAILHSEQVDCTIDRPSVLLNDLPSGNYLCRIVLADRAPEFCRFTKM